MSCISPAYSTSSTWTGLLGDRRGQLGGPVGMTIDPQPGDLGDASERPDGLLVGDLGLLETLEGKMGEGVWEKGNRKGPPADLVQ
jgi:hypothetical protein